jgi:CRISPR-associated exonuclease Cas4
MGKNLSITATHLLEYLYCPRFSYFEHVLDIPEHQGKRFKVEKGRTIHEVARTRNQAYLRKKIGVKDKQTDVYLSSPAGIRGSVDEVLFLNDGTAAPLDFISAEYKEKIFKTYRFQLIFYARLITDNFQIPVNRGFIVYTRSNNKLVDIEITDDDYVKLEKIIKEIQDVIYGCHYPKPTATKRRCPDCCYRNICESTI